MHHGPESSKIPEHPEGAGTPRSESAAFTVFRCKPAYSMHACPWADMAHPSFQHTPADDPETWGTEELAQAEIYVSTKPHVAKNAVRTASIAWQSHARI